MEERSLMYWQSCSMEIKISITTFTENRRVPFNKFSVLDHANISKEIRYQALPEPLQEQLLFFVYFCLQLYLFAPENKTEIKRVKFSMWKTIIGKKLILLLECKKQTKVLPTTTTIPFIAKTKQHTATKRVPKSKDVCIEKTSVTWHKMQIKHLVPQHWQHSYHHQAVQRANWSLKKK